MIRLKGAVTSGNGVGKKYVSMPVYNGILTNILKAKPFEGTLNIVLNNLCVEELISRCAPNIVNDISFEGNTYGGFYYWNCRIINERKGISEDVIVLRPFRTRNPKNVVELISSKYLRERLMLEDGDAVLLEFLCG
ncbi:MAG: DUF120 domain-containing protein [Sulfolobales archaeon]